MSSSGYDAGFLSTMELQNMYYFAAFKMRTIDAIPPARRMEWDGYHLHRRFFLFACACCL
jgi:hypothetical protein